MLAYTASFGGGFAATISVESEGPGSIGSNSAGSIVQAGGSESSIFNGAWGGQRFPDIVGALSVHQAWGTAQVSGVAHNVRGVAADGSTLDTWGWAVDAGVTFNIPNIAGSMIGLTGVWSQNATWYSGLPDGMWDGTPNDNGQGMALGDAAYNGNGTWAKPEAWSVTGWAQFQVSPTVTLGAEGSYGEIRWSNLTNISMLSNSKAFLVGGIAHYDPVKNLDFEFELLYENTKTDQPVGYLPGGGPATGFTNNWHGNADGFAARFEVTRSF